MEAVEDVSTHVLAAIGPRASLDTKSKNNSSSLPRTEQTATLLQAPSLPRATDMTPKRPHRDHSFDEGLD